MHKVALLTALLLGIFSNQGLSEPVIYIVRHGEEPPDVAWGLGALGFLRAHAIAAYFTKLGHEVDEIYAPIPDEKSGRAFQTCEPIASALKKKVYLFHKRDEVDALAKDLRKEVRNGKSVLVCWTNRNIQDMAYALGVPFAPKWDPSIFDDLWEITLNSKAKLSIKKHDLPAVFEVPTEPYFTEEFGVVKTLKTKFPGEYLKIESDCPVSRDPSVHRCNAGDWR